MNRIDTINHLVNQHQPDIFTIQEANLRQSDDINQALIQGYHLEVDNLIETNKIARVVTYINKQLKYTRIKSLESKIDPVIWIEVQLPGNKKLRIQNYYRQWQQMTDRGAIPDTKSVAKQKIRFSQITKTWAEQIETEKTEVISLSDTNINLDLDYTSPENLDIHDKNITPIFRILNDTIFNIGASVIKTNPTKINHNKDYTFIDHLITNHPHKIIKSEVLYNGWGDHLIQKYVWKSKIQIRLPQYRIARDYKIVNWSQLKAEIFHDQLISIAKSSEDPEIIAKSIIEAINNNLETQAPLKRIQVNNKLPHFISTETIETIKKEIKHF